MSKRLLPSFLAAASGLLFTLAAQDASPPAAVPPKATNRAVTPKPPKTPVVPPSDPFVRDPSAQKAPKALEVAEPAPKSVNLLATLETWSLSQADFAAILDGPADERAPYDRLEELAKTGKATLVGLIAMNTRSGHRAVVASIDEFRYPTEFNPAGGPGEIAFPTAWETRNTGDTMEAEMVLGENGQTIDINLVPQTVLFEGFKDWQAEAAAIPLGQPNFRTEKVTTSMSLHSGRPAFLATATPAVLADAKGDPEVRIRVLRATAQPVAPSPPLAEGTVSARVEFLLYSMDREDARRIVNQSSDSAQSYAAVRDLLAKGEAQLEAVSAFVTKSGQRGINEESFEFRYPSEFTPPRLGSPNTPEARNPASPTAFETRLVGISVEIEPVLGPEGRIVDINVVPQIVNLGGTVVANGVAAKYPPQPLFTTRKVTTNVSSGAGVPVLLGTMSRPRETGVNDRKDDGRSSLAYIRVTPVRP